jgi:hypothetical protein
VSPARSVCAVLIVAALVLVGGCGPTRKRPAEADVSGIPAPVLGSFRRERPNNIILDAREVNVGKDARWRITHFTPRAATKVTLYSPDGDKIDGW